MESAPSFLAAIQLVLMRPIRETKSHSRLMRAWPGEHQRISADTLHSEHVRCRASALAEMESAQGFLAAIRWVSLRQIRETKSHPRPMRGLAGASIRASQRTSSPEDMHVA